MTDSDDDEFCRLERGKADEEVHDTAPDIGRCRSLTVTLDKIGLLRRPSREGTRAIEICHETMEGAPNPCP